MEEIEDFVRNNLTSAMLKDDSVNDYLGIFSQDQKNFKILSGQKRMLQVISEYCQTLYTQTLPVAVQNNVLPPQSGSQNLSTQSMLIDEVDNYCLRISASVSNFL